MDGAESRAEPSTLKPDIEDGSMPQEGTFHDETASQGRFGHLEDNYLVICSFLRKIPGHAGDDETHPKRNLPCWGHESRMVRVSGSEPSAVEVDFMEGSGSKAEPSTLRA